MNFVEIHLNDYAAATFHLSPLEDGIYWRLLRCYYRDEAPIPAEISEAARMVGARTAEEISAVEVVLKEFFSLEADGWRQSRCDDEIARITEKREKAREAAAASWESRRKATAKQTHSDRNATHSPTTHSPNNSPSESNSRKPRPLTVDDLIVEGVDPQVAVEWLALRKRKRAPLTPRAWEAIKREAAKIGWTPAQAVEKANARGWQGFEAAWVERELGRQGGAPLNRQEALEQRNAEVARRWLEKTEVTP